MFASLVQDAATAIWTEKQPDEWKYHNDPVLFVKDILRVKEIAPYQEEAMRTLVADRRLCIRSCHGAGKTCLSAWLILWFVWRWRESDCKVVTTASAWRQLNEYLWPEVRKWARRAQWGRAGVEVRENRELLSLSLTLGGAKAFAVASNDHEKIEGAHASNLLYVFDEAKAIAPETWDAAEGAFSQGNCFALAISTPGEPVGRFYDIQQRKPGYEDWTTVHWSVEDALAAGRIDKGWVDARRTQWGENSAVFLNRVMGAFASSDEEGVIPLSWVEMANERWAAAREIGFGPLTGLGVDVARSGSDATVRAYRHGDAISELKKTTKEDTMQTAGRVANDLDANPGVSATVDVVGLGAGTVDRLRERGYSVIAFNGAEKTELRDRSGELPFQNKRAASWWGIRERLDPAYNPILALPPNDDLTGDLTSPKWRINSSGKICIEEKEEVKKRLGRSPDYGDAVCYAMWTGGAVVGAALNYEMNAGRGERGVIER